MRRREGWAPALLVILAAILVIPAALPALGAAPPASPAASADELLARGNDLYAHGDFARAAESYRRILEAGIRNGKVYYNLGNACFRLNKIGEAILHYEKALKLDPADADARENLRYANLRIRDRIPSDDLPILLALLERARNLMTLEQVTLLFAGLYLSGMILSASWILGNGRRWAPVAGWIALGLLGLSLLSGGWMVLQGRARAASDAAIVLSEKVDVLSGPGAENTLLASVHEGTKVRIHNRREAWVQVTLPDGRAGWMLGDSLGAI